MPLKDNILYSLNSSGKMIEGLIDSLTPPEDWVTQACPNTNHPLWVIGHLGMAAAMFEARAQGQEYEKPEGWTELFWFGSQPTSSLSDYPPVDEVLAYFRDSRAKLIALVESKDPEYFEQPAPSEGMFADAPNMGQLFVFAAYHEGIHTGQFTVVHRHLGNQPMFQPQPAQAES